MELAENLRLLRKKQGVSQEELADAIGVSRQAISKWEGGHTKPDMERAAALAAYFGVTVDSLISCENAEAKRDVAEPTARTRRKSARLATGILMFVTGLLAVLLCHLAYGLADGVYSFEMYLNSIHLPIPLYGMFWFLIVGGVTLLLSDPLAAYLGLRQVGKPPRLSLVAAALLLATAVLTAITLAFVPSETPTSPAPITDHLAEYSCIHIDYKAAILLCGIVPLGAIAIVFTIVAHRRLKKTNSSK